MWFKHPHKRRNFFRRAQMAPYQARRFQNPFFQAKPKLKIWLLAIIGFFIGLIIALTSFFLTAPIFKISAVRVEGIETIDPKEMQTVIDSYLSSRAWIFFNHRNRFLFKEKKLEEILNKKYFFSSLQIKQEEQTLAIVIKEKISSFLWLVDNQAFLLDENGGVIRLTTAEELNAILYPPSLQGPTLDGQPLPEPLPLLIFKDLGDQPVSISQTLLSTTEISNLRIFFETLKNNQIYIEGFELNRNVGSWFSAKISNGYSVLFDPGGDIDLQINHLILVLKEQIKDFSGLEYIDIRFGNHVYYK